MDSFLLGRDLLVAPVMTDGKSDRLVYLPQDAWVHLWTGQSYPTSQTVLIQVKRMSPHTLSLFYLFCCVACWRRALSSMYRVHHSTKPDYPGSLRIPANFLPPKLLCWGQPSRGPASYQYVPVPRIAADDIPRGDCVDINDGKLVCSKHNTKSDLYGTTVHLPRSQSALL